MMLDIVKIVALHVQQNVQAAALILVIRAVRILVMLVVLIVMDIVVALVIHNVVLVVPMGVLHYVNNLV